MLISGTVVFWLCLTMFILGFILGMINEHI